MIRAICICLLLSAFIGSSAQVIEVETGTLSGTQKSSQLSGYSGTGYVTGFDADGDKVSLTVTANQGIYNLHVRYASPSGDKFNFVFVNGQNLGSVSFPQTSAFKETKIGKIYLEGGTNLIAIVKDWGYF